MITALIPVKSDASTIELNAFVLALVPCSLDVKVSLLRHLPA
jgi:hypothetical protein